MRETGDIRWTFLQSAAAEIMSAAAVEHRFEEHFHDTWAIGCIDRGECRFRAAGKPMKALAGDLVVLPPYMVHTGGAGDAGLAYRMAYVSESWLASLSELVLGSSESAFAAVVIHDRAIARRLSRALTTASMRDAERKALLAQALVSLLARHARPRAAGASRASLADIRSASRSALIHRFTRRFGLSPLRYERNLRCVSGKALLQQGMPIVEAAHALGFSDQAHFTREFKRVHHITPGAYSRLARMRTRTL